MSRSSCNIDPVFYRSSANRLVERITRITEYIFKIKGHRDLTDLELQVYWALIEMVEDEVKHLLDAVEPLPDSLNN